jgi:hypothetical protein
MGRAKPSREKGRVAVAKDNTLAKRKKMRKKARKRDKVGKRR